MQSAVWQELAGGLSSAHDLCIAAPTGSGKTLAYALPVINALARWVGGWVPYTAWPGRWVLGRAPRNVAKSRAIPGGGLHGHQRPTGCIRRRCHGPSGIRTQYKRLMYGRTLL